MDALCRFCLKVPNKAMCKLEDHKIFKIQTCLAIQISRHESFPNQLCKECANKVEELHEFHSKIIESERKLLECLLNDSLQDYYLKLTDNITIKKENTEAILFCVSKEVKNEDSGIGISSEDNIKRKENDSNGFSQSDDLKFEGSEVDDCNEIGCNTTDDEITLSSIKKEKEIKLNTHNNIPKRIKKIPFPKQSKKSDRLKDTQNTTLNTDFVKRNVCLTCLKVCDTQTDLIKHYNDEHFKTYKNTIKLKYTENVCNGNVSYKCDGCEKVCNMKKDIVKHVVTHDEERPLICKLCGRMYKTVSEIIRHGRVHSGLKLQCTYNCGYSTAYQGALKEHENRHRDMYKYTCEKCGKGFHVRTWYEQHQNIHNGLKPFVCDICGLAFHMARYLTAHRSLMHPQSSSVKRYICIHCNQKCDSANSLALHLEEHGINKVKDFLCDFCGKILASADQLKYHHRMHSGDKPYSCSICSKTFAKKFNVKVHMSSHTGEKTHACARCGKRYTQRSTMLRHLKRHHTGSSPKRTG